MKKIISILGIIILLALGYYYYQQSKKDNNNEPIEQINKKIIKIGIILPLTGNTGFIGKWHQQGFDAALNDIDTSKYVIKVFYQDSKNNAKDGLLAYNYLKNKNVDIIISAMSNVSVPLLTKTNRDKIPLFVTSVSYPDFPKSSKYAFRYNITSDKEGKLAAKEIAKKFNKVNLFYINDEYGYGAKKSFEKESKNYKLTINNSQPFGINQTDFKNVIAKFDKNTTVYVAGYGRSYVTLLRQILSHTKKDTIYSVYGMDFPEFRKPLIGSNKIIGYTYPYRIPNDKYSNFFNNFKKTYMKEPNLVNVFSYDLLTLINNIILNSKNYKINVNDIINKKFGKSLYGYDIKIDSLGEINVPLEFNYINL